MKKKVFDKKTKKMMKKIRKVVKKSGATLSSEAKNFVNCDKCNKSVRLVIRLND